MSKMKKTRKPGGGRKKLNPEYDAGKNLKEQMDSAVALYDSEMSLQAIGDELGLNPIKVRKLLITAGVTYIYGMFYRFGLIDVPDEVKEKMRKLKRPNKKNETSENR